MHWLDVSADPIKVEKDTFLVRFTHSRHKGAVELQSGSVRWDSRFRIRRFLMFGRGLIPKLGKHKC